MNAPAKQTSPVADAWAIVHYALGKFGEESGKEVFSAWLNTLPQIDFHALRETCEVLNGRKAASSFVTITLATVKDEYLARTRSAGGGDEAPAACGICANIGVVGVMVAGESLVESTIVPCNQISSWGYAVQSTMPCRCQRGQKIADKMRQKPASESRMRYLFSQCAFASLRDADNAVRACIRLRRERVAKESKTAKVLV